MINNPLIRPYYPYFLGKMWYFAGLGPLDLHDEFTWQQHQESPSFFWEVPTGRIRGGVYEILVL